ncbi:MAG: galactokinase [Candidatus Bathyarchaeia archaeon]
MIISKTPLRLTLGGGGTDLPPYCSKYGGFVVTSALSKYIYLVVKRRFENEVRVSYSITEIVKSIRDIKHPVVREALKLLGLRCHLEIVSIADVPSETGLGSSGSFTVGLLHALHAFKDENPTRLQLAAEAAHLQMEILREPCGVQDPYIAAFGGFICLEITRNGKVNVSNLKIADDTIRELENNLLFFYTGIKRSASAVLQEQANRIENNSSEALEAMHSIKKIGFEVKHALEQGNLTEFGKLQHEHWMAKKSTSPQISNDPIDRWYTSALKNGAIGGKIMGAGGGGFLMLYCENDKDRVRKAMAREGLREVRFQFEREGSKIVINL